MFKKKFNWEKLFTYSQTDIYDLTTEGGEQTNTVHLSKVCMHLTK